MNEDSFYIGLPVGAQKCYTVILAGITRNPEAKADGVGHGSKTEEGTRDVHVKSEADVLNVKEYCGSEKGVIQRVLTQKIERTPR